MSKSREGKMQIGGFIDIVDVYTLQELLMRESRERRSKKTMQEALEEMLVDYCTKHGVKLPGTTGKGRDGESV